MIGTCLNCAGCLLHCKFAVEFHPNIYLQVQNPAVPNHNAMVIYQPGLYGNELVYYPITQASIPQTIQPIRNGAVRNEKVRNSAGGRSGANRGNYLGYSAGKATFGRYYSKNNSDRGDPPCLELLYDSAAPVADGGMHAAVLTGSSAGLPSVPTSPTIPFNPSIGATQFATPHSHQVPQTVSNPAVYPAKNPDDVLEGLCQTSMWGIPSYQLFSSLSSDGRQLFVYKVTIPAFANIFQVGLTVCNFELPVVRYLELITN